MYTMKSLLLSLCLLPVIVFGQSRFIKVKEELVFTNAPFAQCHASTLVETRPGSLLLAVFGGAHEGADDVAIWTSRQEKGAWQQPIKVADGMTPAGGKGSVPPAGGNGGDFSRADSSGGNYPCWNPVLFKPGNNTLWLFYKVGPNPRQWWGMLKTSENDGETWSAANPLPAGILGPVKNKPVRLADGSILAPSSVEVSEQRWQAHIERSTDGGRHWQFIPIDTANAAKVIQPSILQYPGHRLQVLCRSNQDKIMTAWSHDDGLTWGRLAPTTLPNPNSGTDAVTLKSGTQLLVYNPTTQGKEWFNSRGKLAVAVSKDGVHWQQVLLLEDGSNETNEYSYPAVIQAQDGLVHISYTYNRKNVKHVVVKEIPAH